MPFARIKAGLGTLRARLVIWITATVLLMVVVTMLIVRYFVHQSLINEFDRVLLDDASEIALTLKQTPTDQDKRALTGRALAHSHQSWFVEIFDEDGDRLWQTENTPDFLPMPYLAPDFTPFEDVEEYRVLLSRLPRSSLWVRLGSSKQSMVEDEQLLNRIMILASMLIVFVAPLGAYILAGCATRPLAWIIATTARLQPQKLDERLPIRGSDDELDQLSSTINGMLDRIASYIERHRDFIANAAHELRSPLAAIRSTVEVALNRPRTTEEYHALLTDVMIECSRLGTLVNRLLLLAEGDAGRLVQRDQVVCLDQLVRQSVDMFQAVAESQGIDLRIDGLDPLQVKGDEVQVRQVIRNLIDNAIKFNTAPGAVTLQLRTDPDKKLGYLTVADTGVGIAPDQLPRVFERFYRGDKSRNWQEGPGGYGLGLSICQLIVRSLGGELTVKSQLGQGSTFTAIFPALAEQAVAETAAS